MDDGYWEITLSSTPDLWSPGTIEDAAGVIYDERCFGRGERLDLSCPLRLPEYPFGQCQRTITHPLFISVAQDGRLEGIRFMSGGGLVVPSDVADAIEELAGESVQRIHVYVRGKDKTCELLNVSTKIDCIDYGRSQIDWWTADNGPPHLVGRPLYVARLVIDPEVAKGHHIFRPVGWETVVIVSSTLMNTLGGETATGVEFTKV